MVMNLALCKTRKGVAIDTKGNTALKICLSLSLCKYHPTAKLLQVSGEGEFIFVTSYFPMITIKLYATVNKSDSEVLG